MSRAAFDSTDFRFAMGARFALTLGIQMQAVAIGWQIYAMTHDPLDLGWVGLSQFLPVAGLSLVAGDVADRFDRRRVIVTCQLGMAGCAAALLAITWRHAQTPAPLYAVVMAFGVLRAFSGPASSALVPNLVLPEHYQNAVAWSSTVWQVATIAGPSAGGALYAIGSSIGGDSADAGAVTRGASWVYGASGLLALLAASLMASIKLRKVRGAKKAVSLATVFEGVRYVFAKRILLGSISLDLFAVLLGGATALLPIFAKDVLFAGAIGLGILRSAPGVGAAAVALFVAHRPLKRRAGPIMFVCVFAFGIATCVFALSKNIVLSAVALVVLGAVDMVSVVIRATLVQLATPDEKRGRVSAVNMIFIGASNELGEFESGLTARWLGAVQAALVGGIATCVVVVVWAGLFPSLRKVDRLEDELAPG